MKIIVFICVAFLLIGCAQNNFSEFYYDQTGGVDLEARGLFILPDPNKNALLYKGKDMEEDGTKC